MIELQVIISLKQIELFSLTEHLKLMTSLFWICDTGDVNAG